MAARTCATSPSKPSCTRWFANTWRRFWPRHASGAEGRAFEPTEFLEKLAAMPPKPRLNLLIYHGAFAPHARRMVARCPAARRRGSARLLPARPRTTAIVYGGGAAAAVSAGRKQLGIVRLSRLPRWTQTIHAR